MQASPGELGAGAPTKYRNRLLGEVELTPAMVAKVVMVTLADYLDQMVTSNGWRDHHQVWTLTRSWLLAV